MKNIMLPKYMTLTATMILAIVLSTLSSQSIAATLSATVDRTNIQFNETLLLTLTLDKQGADNIDFSALELQFDIVQQQRSSQTSIVNGRISAQTQWQLFLAPKEVGDLIIPSFSSLGAFSDAITITVSDSQHQGSSNQPDSDQSSKNNSKKTDNVDNDVFLEASINNNTVYVQEQLLLTLRLYYRISLSGYTPQDLDIPNSTVTLTTESNTKRTINGSTYNVLERIYAIHPQASGELIIPAQSWQVEKSLNRFGFGRITSPFLRINSKPLSITIKPIPTDSSATHWLPASYVTLEQEWQQSTITAKVGEPLTYSLTIKANGLSHSQLPTLTINNDEHFTVYSDQATTDNALSATGILGTRTSNYAIIPKKTGTYTLPPMAIKWWNTLTNQEETITLKPQKIIVAQSQLGAQSSITLPDQTNISSDSPIHTVEPSTDTLWIWKVSTAILFLSTIILLVLWQRSQKNRQIDKVRQDTPIIDKQGKTLQQHYQKIERAIEEQQWHQLPTLIIEWASIKTNTDIHNQDTVVAHFPHLREALESLNKQLYSKNSIVVWDFSLLLPLLKQQKEKKRSKRSAAQELTTLYP